MTKQSCLVHFSGAALVAGAAIFLAAACGRNQEPKNENRSRASEAKSELRASAERPLPSAISDVEKKSMTSVAPAPMAAIEKAAESARAVATSEPEKKSYKQLIREGKKLAQQGEHGEAMESLEAAAAMKPKAATPRIEIARALVAAGKSSEAREHAEAAVEIAPRSSYAWNTLGRVELGEGDLEAAVASFERATDENADNSYAWNNLGLVLNKLERFEEAANALEMATSGAKPKPYMWNNLGMAYEHLDRIVEARAAYRQAADNGSSKGEASLERLEGVTSLAGTEREAGESEYGEELALELDMAHDGE